MRATAPDHDSVIAGMARSYRPQAGRLCFLVGARPSARQVARRGGLLQATARRCTASAQAPRRREALRSSCPRYQNE